MSSPPPPRPQRTAQTTYAKRKRDGSGGDKAKKSAPPAVGSDEDELEVIHFSPSGASPQQEMMADGQDQDPSTSRIKRQRTAPTAKEVSIASMPSDTASTASGPTTPTKTSASPQPPRTPPAAARTDASTDIHTPRTPPRDLSAVYRAVSPSPRAPGRHDPSESIGNVPAPASKAALPLRGRKRMLSRTESYGSPSSKAETASPTASPVVQARTPAFGSPLGTPPIPTTPSSRSTGLSRAYSEILSPSRKTPLGSTHSLPVALSPSRSPAAPSAGSGERPTIRTYGGRSRSFLQEPLEPLKLPTPDKSGKRDGASDPFARPAAPKRSYAEQRQYLQVDVNEEDMGGDTLDLASGLQVSCCRPSGNAI